MLCRQRTAAVCRNGFSEEQPRRPRISTRAASMSLQLTAVEKQSEGGPTASILFSLLGSLKAEAGEQPSREGPSLAVEARHLRPPFFTCCQREGSSVFRRAMLSCADTGCGPKCQQYSANLSVPWSRICFGNKSMYALVYTFACHLRPPHPTCCKRDVFLENGGTCSQATKCLPHCRRCKTFAVTCEMDFPEEHG